jgi:hypothetical protein
MSSDLPPVEKLRITALLVASKLREYVALHDRIYRQSATFSSVLKNLFGVRVPFEQFASESAQMAASWRSALQRIQGVRDDVYDDLTAEEQRYFNCLQAYAAAVANTVEILSENQAAMYQASLGAKRSTLSQEDVLRQQQRYEAAISRYCQLGDQLNQLNYIVFA